MSAAWIERLPWCVALAPWVVFALNRVSDLNLFSAIRGLTDPLCAFFFFPFVLLYSEIGVIRWSVLGGGAHWSHDLIYVQTSSVVFYALAQWMMRLVV